jgi:nucleotide-binding universal stress UspA family protein
MKVLVPVDGSVNSLNAVRHVIDAYRQRHDLEVHLLHVRRPFSELVARFSSRGNRESYHRDAAERALAAARALLARSSVPRVEHVEIGSRGEVIDRVAADVGVSRIVIGTARRNSLTRLIEDSVTLRLLRSGRAPVDVVVGPEISKLEFPAIVAAALLGFSVVALIVAG